ncbi:hypothetical protein AGMMS49975_09630 [Clostridia bacterium]|nr:hypothetical protein AGMMS49975_09630 [Clostridia bacterium]
MRKLKIAYGSSCFAKQWSNKTVTFDELCERLKTTIRTSETAEEYPKLPKGEREKIKDKGGFVPALLRDGRRKRENVVCRSMLVLDGDKVKCGFLEDFEMLNINAAVIYSTHSHTPKAPRLRIIVPLTRDVTSDKYNAIARYYAESLGIDQFDECSYRPHQLMYWPSTPSNGEYIFKSFDGEWLEPDDILNANPNWRDVSTLPTSSRESKIITHEIKKQADPLEKKDLIGAFNNVYYPIQTLLEVELSDIYEPVGDDRYSFISADSIAGGVVYDDKFFYSNHASDPAYGRLLNAFDLARVHRFGDLDEKQSVKKMLECVQNNNKVKIWLAKQRLEQANSDFSEPPGNGNNNDWQSSMSLGKSGAIEDVYENYVIIAQNDSVMQNVAYNELRDTLDIRGEIPWEHIKKGWSKSDEVGVYGYISHIYGLYSPTKADNAIKYAADKRRFHPIREYLNALPDWDGVCRIDDLLIRCMQADNTDYVRTVTRKTFTAAVTRIYKPGTKFDSVLVFDGVQGIGKSSLFKELVGDDYYSETLSLTDMDDKSAAEKLQGFWVVEIGELAGMKKADIEKVKAFLSTSDDKYRPSYGKVVESHPRQCVIIASVNGERGYLRDITGNRRFWIVKVRQEEQSKKYNISPEERDQIWAEAKFYYENGDKLYLEGDLIKSAEEAQKEAMEQDERQGAVEEYLNTLLPTNWDSMDLFKRREYLRDCKDDDTLPKGEIRRETISNAEIWCECYRQDIAFLKTADSYALAALMLKVDGWERCKAKKRIAIYGEQRFYKRTRTVVANEKSV